MALQKIDIQTLSFNPFTKISQEWALLSAGTPNHAGTMTVSWGGVGHIWNKDVVTVYVRKSRYTKEFLDSGDTFTLSFYDSSQKQILSYLGSVSGRDENKIEKCGLTLAYSHDALYFEEAKLVFVCRKMCHVPLTPETFDDPALDASIYGDKDYHTLYIGEILKVWKQD